MISTIQCTVCVSDEECTWSDREYQLAEWAFRKWKYHQFTSLRVSGGMGKVKGVWKGGAHGMKVLSGNGNGKANVS